MSGWVPSTREEGKREFVGKKLKIGFDVHVGGEGQTF